MTTRRRAADAAVVVAVAVAVMLALGAVLYIGRQRGLDRARNQPGASYELRASETLLTNLPDPGPGSPAAATRLVPLDPRVSVRDPVGTLIFRAMLEQMCAGLPPTHG